MTTVHKDMIGREINVGDYVAYSQWNMLMIGQVVKLTPKRIHCQCFNSRRGYGSTQKGPGVMLVDSKDVTAWTLKGCPQTSDRYYA